VKLPDVEFSDYFRPKSKEVTAAGIQNDLEAVAVQTRAAMVSQAAKTDAKPAATCGRDQVRSRLLKRCAQSHRPGSYLWLPAEWDPAVGD